MNFRLVAGEFMGKPRPCLGRWSLSFKPLQRYNGPMVPRIILISILLSGFVSFSQPAWAIPSTEALTEQDQNTELKGGFAKPYEYERRAYGYDPEGVEYKENQAEDFQVIFITATPFAALFSFGVTGLVSLLSSNSFGVGGDYFIPFLAGTLAGSTTVACVSVLTNQYPPPDQSPITKIQGPIGDLALKIPLLTANF